MEYEFDSFSITMYLQQTFISFILPIALSFLFQSIFVIDSSCTLVRMKKICNRYKNIWVETDWSKARDGETSLNRKSFVRGLHTSISSSFDKRQSTSTAGDDIACS